MKNESRSIIFFFNNQPRREGGWGRVSPDNILKKTLIIIGVVIVILVFIIIGAKVSGSKNNKDEDKIEVARRGRFVVKHREYGHLEPLLSVDVKSNVEGEIEKLNVKEGNYVEKGQILLKIDDKYLQEEKKQAKANMDAAKAQLEQAKRNANLTEKQQDSALEQSQYSLEVAEANLESAKAYTVQQIGQAETEIATTENALEQDKISLQQAKITFQQAELMSKQYESALESAKVALQNAESELNRNQELYEKKFVAKKTVEDAQTRYANAKSQYEAATKNVQSQKKTVESQKTNIEARGKAIESRKTTLEFQKRNVTSLKESRAAQEKQAIAQLNTAQTRLKQILDTITDEKEISKISETTAGANLLRAESSLKTTEERLAWATITAPMSGMITQLTVEEGEIVTSGRSAWSQGPAIMTISDLSKMLIKTNVNQVDISKIKLGQRVEIEVEAYPDDQFTGKVKEISPSGKFQENIIKFEVIVEVAGDTEKLRPGMRARVDIITVDKENVLQLPIEAVLEPQVITVKATVNPHELGKLDKGKKVKIENLAGKEFDGKVSQISSAKTDENVEILIDGTPRGLRIGPTEIAIVLSEDEKITKVETLIESEKKYFVMLDKEEDEPKESEKKNKKSKTKGVKTEIRVGERNNSNFEILEGVGEGDRVFVPSLDEVTKKKNQNSGRG